MENSLNKKKLLVVDTSVLLYDKSCIQNLSENDIVIPMIVLEELDRFKSKEGILGENSRYFNRYLDEIRKDGGLQQGIKINSQFESKIRVETNILWDNIELLDKKDNDNIIIATTNFLKNKYSEVYKDIILITKDINLRVKCDAANIKANDYYSAVIKKAFKNES